MYLIAAPIPEGMTTEESWDRLHTALKKALHGASLRELWLAHKENPHRVNVEDYGDDALEDDFIEADNIGEESIEYQRLRARLLDKYEGSDGNLGVFADLGLYSRVVPQLAGTYLVFGGGDTEEEPFLGYYEMCYLVASPFWKNVCASFVSPRLEVPAELAERLARADDAFFTALGLPPAARCGNGFLLSQGVLLAALRMRG